MPKQKMVEYNGQTKSISAWIRDLGLNKNAIFSRLRMGWDVKRAFTTPVSASPCRAKQIAFSGKTQSMSAWAREIGCSICQLSKRLKGGMPVEEALTKPFGTRRHSFLKTELLEFNGVKKTLMEWGAELQIKPSTLYDRLHKGWTIEAVLTTPLGHGAKKTYSYKGEEKSLAEWAELKGLPEKLLRGRIDRGWLLERALETPMGGKVSRSVMFQGKPRSLREISLITGIATGTISGRLSKGWSIEQVVSTPVDTERSKSRILEFNGEQHTAIEWSRLRGIPAHLILQRIDYGWTIEKALTEPVAERKYHSLTYKGQTLSMSDWARLMGMKFTTLSQRIKAGWSVEDALTTGNHQKWHFKKKAKKPQPVRKPREKPYFYNGQKMGSAEFSEALKIPRGTLYYFLKKGLTQEQIIDRAVNGARDERGHLIQGQSAALEGRYIYNGKRCTQKQLAKMWGVQTTLFSKYKKRGFSVQDLIAFVEQGHQLPPLFTAGNGRGRGRPMKEVKIKIGDGSNEQEFVEYEGVKLSYRDFANQHGLTVDYVEKMIDLGIGPAEIVRVSAL